VEACSEVVRQLPADFRAAVFVTVHFPSHGTSVLPRILSREGPLPAVHANNGEPFRPGQIYVAPPDQHLLVGGDRIRLWMGPRENGNRPAVDPMFRSAALAHGPRVIGVVLSGNLGDGTSGLLTIKQHGGVAVVQDPEDAMYPSMPSSALEHVPVDLVAPAAAIGSVLAELVASAALIR
jgi:two-component system chemotaxis response regulator CheB